MKDWIADAGEPDTVIETGRLRLRPMRADDLEGLLGIFGDPRVMAAFHTEPFGPDQMRGWLDHALEHWERHGFGLFAVLDKTDGTLVGDCGLERMEIDGRHELELGFDFRSDHWGRGLATEAAGAVRDHAFEVLGVPRLVSLIRVGNEASRRVAEKIGMRHERDLTRGETAYWLYALDSPYADRVSGNGHLGGTGIR